MQRVICLSILLLNISFCTAQLFPAKHYPQDYFIWPVDATKSLSANFGELRSNHYHMGYDCRTDQRENKPVYAAADGYIAKVKIEPWGFGRAIYINHPNGYTTLYAHLNDFYPELEDYIKTQQYKLKSWKVFLENIPAGLFRVKKGDFIAYSGNTGGSQGPHLHFEIRDTKTDDVLNPALFNVRLADNVPPSILRLAMYDMQQSMYEQSPKLYSLKKINGIYTPTTPVIIANSYKVSFAISANDKVNGSNNANGIYEAVLFDNDKPVIGFQLDKINYDATRYLNAHIDYKYKKAGGPYLQHLSKLPGYYNSIYAPKNADGIIVLDNETPHQIKIEVKDTDGNSSFIEFDVKRNTNFSPNKEQVKKTLAHKTVFHPGFINVFENSNIRFYLPENSLYDSFVFTYNETMPNTGYTIHQLHNTLVPLHGYFPVSIKGPSNFAISSDNQKMVIHRWANGKDDYKKAVPNKKDKNWFTASFREFGQFQLLIDNEPPVITPIGFRDGMNCSNLSRIIFSITDNTEEVENFTATLDGKWLRFSNDKGRKFIYEFDEKCSPGSHELKIFAEDLVGNKTEKTYQFTR